MTLLFIYNANSGKLNALFDVDHKLFSPSTYKCNLCALTFDVFSENNIWKAFREESNITMEFFHIDEFEKIYPEANFSYPIIIEKNDDRLQPFLLTKNINKIVSAKGLITIILKKIDEKQAPN